MNQKLKNPIHDQLFRAVLSLETLEECYEFFEDICTIGELKSISQRLEVARLLKAGTGYEPMDIIKFCLVLRTRRYNRTST